MDGRWPTQDAKQRLSELLRAAHGDGPQIVTKHGAEVAVVLDVAEYRRLAGLDVDADLKGVLAGGAVGGALSDAAADVLADVVAERGRDQPRDLDEARAR